MKDIKSVEEIYEMLKAGSSIYDKVSYSDSFKTKGKVKNIQLGRLFINLLLPDDFELIDETLDSKKINNILSQVANNYPPEIAEKITRTINEECLKMSSFYPATFNIESLILPNKLVKKKKETLSTDLNPEEFSKRSDELGRDYVDYLKSVNSGVYDMSKSGVSKASPTDLANLFIAKGPTINFHGQLSKPILNCLNDGFTLDEFYASAEQGR